MSLNEKQAEFTRTVAHFISWCFANDYPVIGAELYRTQEQAQIYKSRGVGILNSNHCLKLAIDLFRLVDGSVSWNREHYQQLGDKWKSMHPLARWGGDFKRRDCVHFSFEHRGRQ